MLLLEVQKYFLWDEQKCLLSPFCCIAKYISAVDFYAKFQHVLKIPVYSEEFRSVSAKNISLFNLYVDENPFSQKMFHPGC